MIPALVGRTKVLLIDTPGFDDTDRTDSEVLTEIARLLAGQYELGFELKGIIYIHRIVDNRFSGSAVKTFEVFQRICGEEAMSNVLLVTSRWDDVDPATGADRERQLREQFWAYMLGRGSVMTRFYGDRNNAVTVASQLLVKDSVVLALQREMVDERRQLSDTAAGAYVSDAIDRDRAAHEKELRSLEALRQTLRDSDRAMKRQLQLDWERERARLRNDDEQQVGLQQDVHGAVRDELQRAVAKIGGSRGGSGSISASDSAGRSRGTELSRNGGGGPGRKWQVGGQLLPLIPLVLNLLGLFVGIPPGAADLLFSFFPMMTDMLSGIPFLSDILSGIQF